MGLLLRTASWQRLLPMKTSREYVCVSLTGFTFRPRDPDVLVVVTDRVQRLPRWGPSRPAAMDLGQVVLRFVLPVQDRSPLIADQDLVGSLEAVIVVARSEEAILTRHFGMIEQLRLDLRPVGCGMRLVRSARRRCRGDSGLDEYNFTVRSYPAAPRCGTAGLHIMASRKDAQYVETPYRKPSCAFAGLPIFSGEIEAAGNVRIANALRRNSSRGFKPTI